MPKVSKKGQVTIPKEVREFLDIHPGDELEFKRRNDDVKIIKKTDCKVFDYFVGYLKKNRTDEVVRELRGESV
jgi:AbrB family looped-hinge helix DNA binding protein